MPTDLPEQRGVPPTRPFPSQVMHLLELTKLEVNDAATVVHQSPATIEKWMTFKVTDTMPPAQWLVLNLYAYCNKNICFPEPLRAFLRDRFCGALPEAVRPVRKVRIPERPTMATVDEIIDILYDAHATFEELTFVKKGMVDTWLGPDKRPIPYAAYELALMTLWARGQYTPNKAMAEYVREKYNGMFNPKG